jgi:diamine N-acetyltransferase
VKPTGLTPQSRVELREINSKTVRQICNLSVAADQTHLVAPNAHSISEAYFEPKAWFRAIYADDTPVGFVMLYLDPENDQFYLWRFMIDARYQQFGFGRQALEQVIAFVRTHPNAREIKVSYVPEPGNPGPFYKKLGFQETGEVHNGENIMCLKVG